MNFGISERPHPKKRWHHSQKNRQKKKEMGPKFPSGAQKTNILDSANETKTQIPKGSVESIMGWPPVLWLGGHFVATCEIRLYPTIWEKKTSRKRRLLKWRTINTLWLTSDLWKKLPIVPATKWNCSVVASSIIRELLGGGGGIGRFRFWTALEWQVCKSDVPLHILLEYCENLKTIIFFTSGKKKSGRVDWGRGENEGGGRELLRYDAALLLLLLF